MKVYHEGRAQSELSSCTKSNCGSSFERPMYYVDLTPAPMLIADVWYTIAVQIKVIISSSSLAFIVNVLYDSFW